MEAWNVEHGRLTWAAKWRNVARRCERELAEDDAETARAALRESVAQQTPQPVPVINVTLPTVAAPAVYLMPQTAARQVTLRRGEDGTLRGEVGPADDARGEEGDEPQPLEPEDQPPGDDDPPPVRGRIGF
jgi:hypothetical protein